VSARPRLLFLCHTLPYPPDGGVWIRTYHVLRLLARTFDITALCFERLVTSGSGSGGDRAAGGEALRRFGAVEVFPIPQRQSSLRYAWDHLRSLTVRRVYTTYVFESRAYHRRLRELLRSEAFDLVHLDSPDLLGYLPACRGLPVICVHHNVESALLHRRAAVERHGWRSAYLRYQARLMEREERQGSAQVALNVAVSAQDRTLLARIAPASRVTVISNGVDVEEFQPDDMRGTGVAFVGGTNWFPNLDALDFFCDQILPHLRAAGATVPVRWVGSASPEQRRHYRARHGVEVTGYVDDVRPYMREAACHIVPLRAGGGTRLKILNAWAMGKAVVSTSVGCEGLAAADGDNILIRDDPRGFANAVLAVLNDEPLRCRLARRARATVERLYSWEIIGREMTETYLSVAGRRHPDPAPSLIGPAG
jgi:glycosyltransferase involved in cell wall biosynthesis